jgi:hypothetical protein
MTPFDEEPQAAVVRAEAPQVKEYIAHLDDYRAEYDWNCRSAVLAQRLRPQADDWGDDAAPGIEGFAATLEAEGQRDAVDLWRKGDGWLYLLNGFRRTAACRFLFQNGRAIKGYEPGQIRVRFHPDLTELEALELNAADNMNRENLTAPDFVFAIKRIVKLNKKVPVTELAVRYGRSPAFMYQTIKIGERLSPALFDAWRNSPMKPVAVEYMAEIASLHKDDQEAAYKKLLLARQDSRVKPGEKRWINTACRAGTKNGKYLGRLHREGVITVRRERDWLDDVRHLVTFRNTFHGHPVSIAVCRRIAECVRDAFLEELSHPSEDRSDEPDVED